MSTPDPPLTPPKPARIIRTRETLAKLAGYTAVEKLTAVIDDCAEALNDSCAPEAKRNYALAKTATEEAIMRFNRAKAIDFDAAVWSDVEAEGVG